MSKTTYIYQKIYSLFYYFDAIYIDKNRYVCIKTYLYILPEISSHHSQWKCMGGHFFSVPSLPREYYRTL